MKKPNGRKFFAKILKYYRSNKFDEHLDMIIEKMKEFGVPGSKIDKFIKLKSRQRKLIYLASVLGINAASLILPIEAFEKMSDVASNFT